MKKKSGYLLFIAIVVFCKTESVLDNTLLKEEQAQKNILELKQKIEAEDKAYKIALQDLFDETKKRELTTAYYQNKIQLLDSITLQRKMINDYTTQQWLWNLTKVMGPVAVIGITAYQIFKASLLQTKQPSGLVESQVYPVMFDVVPDIIQKKEQPLLKEDVSKYVNASKAYGAATVWFALNALFNPFFYPYAATTFLGSVYYGVKSIQQYPVDLEKISIIPPDMPY